MNMHISCIPSALRSKDDRTFAKMNCLIHRVDIDFDTRSSAVEPEQNGIHIVLIPHDIGGRCSPTVIVVTITAYFKAKHLLVQVELHSAEGACLDRDSTILLELLRMLDQYVGELDDGTLRKVDAALRVSIELVETDGVST